MAQHAKTSATNDISQEGKCKLPKMLSERNIIKVLPDGRDEIHDIITSYVKNIHLFTL